MVSNQQSTGSYIDDTGITTKVKAKLAEEPSLKSGAIAVETLRGTVQLSGFIKTATEKSTAERVARGVSGVTALRNDLIVMP
ncbi:MAG TPA: BON domain-containing protein [Burkholderiaceae bacterium]